jgi:hypothetical protein
MSPELDDYIMLREIHIYRGSFPENPRPRVLRRCGRSDRQGQHEGETLNNLRCRLGGPLLDRAKCHAGGGPGAKYLYNITQEESF